MNQLIALDISAGMDNLVLENKFNNYFNNDNQTVDLVLFDSEIKTALFNKTIKELKHNLSQLLKQNSGLGGTEPQTVVDFAQKKNYDNLIFLTDGHFISPNLHDFKGEIKFVIFPCD